MPAALVRVSRTVSTGGEDGIPITHAYHHPIQVTHAADGKPATLRWRGITYRVLHVNEPWHLMDREWEPPEPPSASGAPGSGAGRSDRTYYHLRCVSTHEDLTCEIYFEAVGAVWILERVYD
jgi:hypothetical protein